MIEDKIIAFFGCKNITKSCIQNFINNIGQVDHLITISPPDGDNNMVSGYMNLKDFASENNIKTYFADHYTLNSDKDHKYIKELKIDIAFAIGWQRLIPAKILDEIKTGTFGMHGSADGLPRGRGRSPMNWALIQNRKQFYTNLFRYEDNIDGGDVIGTQKFDINKFDTIETLHFKNMISMNRLIMDNMRDILDNRFELKKQDEKNATYFPKREPLDGFIDWNLTTKDIHNLSRAVTKPFPGALSRIGNEIITIWELYPFTDSWNYPNAECGEIVEVFYNNKFVVKTGDSTVLVHDYEINNNELIKEGTVLKGTDYEEIYKKIETRYPHFVQEHNKEITCEKIKNLYTKCERDKLNVQRIVSEDCKLNI